MSYPWQTPGGENWRWPDAGDPSSSPAAAQDARSSSSEDLSRDELQAMAHVPTFMPEHQAAGTDPGPDLRPPSPDYLDPGERQAMAELSTFEPQLQEREDTGHLDHVFSSAEFVTRMFKAMVDHPELRADAPRERWAQTVFDNERDISRVGERLKGEMVRYGYGQTQAFQYLNRWVNAMDRPPSYAAVFGTDATQRTIAQAASRHRDAEVSLAGGPPSRPTSAGWPPRRVAAPPPPANRPAPPSRG
jgi:hypothetical protein